MPTVLDTIPFVLACLSPLVWLLKSDKAFRLTSAAIALFWAAYFFYMGLNTGGAVSLLIALRVLTGYALVNAPQKIKTTMSFLFIAAFIASTIVTYQDWTSLLPCFASCWATWAQLNLKGIKLRIWQCAGADSAWIIYDIANGAWGHLLAEIIGICFNIFTVSRMRKAELNPA